MEGAKVLQNALAENQTLEELDLQSNRITNEAIMFIAKGVQKNDSLRLLKVNNILFLNIK